MVSRGYASLYVLPLNSAAGRIELSGSCARLDRVRPDFCRQAADFAEYAADEWKHQTCCISNGFGADYLSVTVMGFYLLGGWPALVNAAVERGVAVAKPGVFVLCLEPHVKKTSVMS